MTTNKGGAPVGNTYAQKLPELRRVRYGSWTLDQSTIIFLNRWCGAYSSVSRGVDALVNVVESLIDEEKGIDINHLQSIIEEKNE